MRPGYWLPPVAWMAMILWLASDTGSAERTGRIILPVLRFLFPGSSPLQLDAMHALVRKGGHLIEYAVLAGLWLRAFVVGRGSARRRAGWQAWAVAVAWAMIDETYQTTVGSRTGSAIDVAVDAAGALAVALPGGAGWRPTADALTRALLWFAAVGGLALVTLNVWTGVDSGALWLTVPAAAITLGVLRWRGRPTTKPSGEDRAYRAGRHRRG